MRGELTIGQLIAFNMLAGRVSDSVLRLVQLWQDFQQAGLSVERLGDILNNAAGAPCQRGGNCEPHHPPQHYGASHLRRQVIFRYRADARPSSGVCRSACGLVR